MDTFDQQVRAARKRAKDRLLTEPHIESAHYDTKSGRVIVVLSNNAWFMFLPENAQGLEHASIKELENIEISPSGFGLHFPLLDAQFDITSLIKGHFGTNKWMAARRKMLKMSNGVRTRHPVNEIAKAG